VREKLAAWQAEGPSRGQERQGYLAQVTFDALKDPAERLYYKRVKTSLKLPKDQVDRLREVAGRLLREAPAFRRLLADLQAGR
jgi:NTE family protein